MTFTVAIIGRPNVGKSTLFNRLVGKRLALVDDTPGVTRDRREARGRIGDLEFRVVDTSGLEEAFDESHEARMRSDEHTSELQSLMRISYAFFCFKTKTISSTPLLDKTIQH